MKTSDFLKLLKKHPIFIENEVMINEAIKELEEIEIRSCDNCKYWFYKTLETNIETCNFGLISHDYKSDSFCCNKWEAKNENL